MPWYMILAAAVLFGLIVANLVARRIFRYEENLRRVEPVVREVFWAQHLFIELILMGMLALCVVFPSELSTTSLGRALSGFLAGFWGLRFVMQFVHYSAEERRRFRALDWLFSLCFLYLSVLFGLLATAVDLAFP